jgi:hypothetical protein
MRTVRRLERAMKMTSKGTLLVAVAVAGAGVIGLGCSSPADDDGEMKAAPIGNPPFVGQLQPQMAAQTPQQTGLAPTTTNEGQGGSAATNVQQTPVAASGGSAGAGAMPAPGTTIPRGVAGTGFALTPMAGWVAGGTNEAGIQGAFSTISDATSMGATTIMPANFTMATGTQICVSGSASQIMTAAMPDYNRYWGGGVALDLGDPGAMAAKVPWNRGRVVGFSFNITGTTIPPMGQFRFGITPYEGSALVDDGPCTNITMGANTIMFSALHSQCYAATPGAALSDTALLASIKWQVATVVTAPTPFNFCISDLKAIVQ